MKTSSHTATPGLALAAVQVLGWALLGGATTVFLFYWCIVGLGAIFGGTEVGNGRVPGVGTLWWVFLLGFIPLSIIGAIITPFLITKTPTVVRWVFAVLGTIALLSVVAVIVAISSGWI